MTPVREFGKFFNNMQFSFVVVLNHHARNTYLFECVYVSEIAWHLLSVPYIQNNLHKRTVGVLLELDRCRGRGAGGRKGKAPWSTMVWRARGEGLVAGRRERAEVQERGWDLRDGVCEGGGGRTGDGGTLSGTPRLWLSGRRCPSPHRGRSCGNLQEREPFAQVNYLKKKPSIDFNRLVVRLNLKSCFNRFSDA